MKYKNAYWIVLLVMTTVVALGTASGCAKRTKAPAEPVGGTAMQYDDRAVIVHRSDEGSRHYYRDDKGKLYYVDQSGAVNVIDRSPRVEQGPAGLYYIIDDDNVSYSTDERGKLYYRDSSGRIVYIEDSNAGRVIDPLPLIRGDTHPRVEYVQTMKPCNDNWRNCLTTCDELSGTNARRNCYNNCDSNRERCLRP